MAYTKEVLVNAIRDAQETVERVASMLPEGTWGRQVYFMGWSAKQLLCHLAASSKTASWLIELAKTPPESRGAGDGVDTDTRNAREVAAREENLVEEILEEVRSNYQQSIEAIQGASEELLGQKIRAPWGMRGLVGDLILGYVMAHDMIHLRDLAGASR